MRLKQHVFFLFFFYYLTRSSRRINEMGTHSFKSRFACK